VLERFDYPTPAQKARAEARTRAEEQLIEQRQVLSGLAQTYQRARRALTNLKADMVKLESNWRLLKRQHAAARRDSSSGAYLRKEKLEDQIDAVEERYEWKQRQLQTATRLLASAAHAYESEQESYNSDFEVLYKEELREQMTLALREMQQELAMIAGGQMPAAAGLDQRIEGTRGTYEWQQEGKAQGTITLYPDGSLKNLDAQRKPSESWLVGQDEVLVSLLDGLWLFRKTGPGEFRGARLKGETGSEVVLTRAQSPAPGPAAEPGGTLGPRAREEIYWQLLAVEDRADELARDMMIVEGFDGKWDSRAARQYMDAFLRFERTFTHLVRQRWGITEAQQGGILREGETQGWLSPWPRPRPSRAIEGEWQELTRSPAPTTPTPPSPASARPSASGRRR
jgi:hypothetical protein